MSTITASAIDLRKEIVKQVASSKGMNNIKAQVVLVLDYSGSMDHLYQSGFVQRVIERLVPVAMQFDDNGEMELYMFQNSCVKHPNNVTAKSVDGIVNREITGKYTFGGTQYAPAIKSILEDYIPSAVQEKKGLFGSMFGGKANVTGNTSDPVYVIFVTDGDNSDKPAAEAAIKEASKYGVFFQFVGIGNASMAFLDKLDTMSGRFIDNANFFQVNDLDKVEDKDLYERLLGEFPSWVNEAKSKNIIK
jgi:hypothetical protein